MQKPVLSKYEKGEGSLEIFQHLNGALCLRTMAFVWFCVAGGKFEGESLGKLKRKMFLHNFLVENLILARTAKDVDI